MLKEHFFASESQKNRVVCLKTTIDSIPDRVSENNNQPMSGIS